MRKIYTRFYDHDGSELTPENLFRESAISVFELDQRFSEPIWIFNRNLHSITKYWVMSQSMIGDKILGNEEFFLDREEKISTERFVFKKDDQITDIFEFDVDGEALENDFSFIPNLNANMNLCMILSCVEAFLKSLCLEIDKEFHPVKRGSYIDQYMNFITQKNGIAFGKEDRKILQYMGNIRNSFMHQMDIQSLPSEAIAYIDSLTQPFVFLRDGLSPMHVEILLKAVNKFGENTQIQYWRHFESQQT